MHLVPASEAVIGQIRKPGKVQALLDEFHSSDEKAVQVILTDRQYKSLAHAQHSFYCAIKKSGYRMISRTHNGNLYLLKL